MSPVHLVTAQRVDPVVVEVGGELVDRPLGTFQIGIDRQGLVVEIECLRSIPPLLGNLPGSLRHPVRIERPVARRGWLENGPGPTRDRGNDSFVEISWDEALDRAADSAQARQLLIGEGRRLAHLFVEFLIDNAAACSGCVWTMQLTSGRAR